MTTIGGMFGSRTDNDPFLLDSGYLKVLTQRPTTRYSPSALATVILSKVKNPAHTNSFGTFELIVFDENMERIANMLQDVTFTSTPGDLIGVKLVPDSLFIDETAKLAVEFVPLHELPHDAMISL